MRRSVWSRLRWWHASALGIVATVAEVAGEAAGLGLFGTLGLVPSAVLIVVPPVLRVLRDRRAPTDPVEEPPTPPNTPLPPPVGLVGRESLVEAVAARLAGQRVVLVHGPAGTGVSAVAAEAARRVVPDPDLQHYLDLRGPDQHRPDSPRRVAIGVLTELGLDQRSTRNLDAAGRRVRDEMRGSGRVLLVDDVTRPDQVSWLLDHVPEAYVIIAGSVDISAMPWPAVAVEPLEAAPALELAARQDPGDHPGRGVADRIAADPDAARDLATRHLARPGAAITIGEWLARNPQVSLRDLRNDFGDQEPSSLATRIRAQLLGTASPDAQALLAALAKVPVAVLPEAAIAALIDRNAAGTAALLDELISYRVVERLRPARYRVLAEARSLGRDAGSVAKGALTRLVRYYGRLAAGHARTLVSGTDPDELARARQWMRSEDTSCLDLLDIDEPPRDAAEDLWQIAWAMDVWFGGQVRPADQREVAEAMVRAAEAIGDTAARQAGHLRLAAVCRAGCDIAGADHHVAEARRLLGESAELGRGGAVFHVNAGLLDLARGRFEQALHELRRGRQQRPRDDLLGRATDRINMGAALLGQGHLESARRRLNDALALAEGADDVAGQAHAQELLGVIHYRQHEPGTARALWARARLLYEQRADVIGQARCLLHEATALLDEDTDPDRAGSMLRHSLELRGSQESGTGVALTYLLLGRLAVRAGRPGAAREHRDAGLAALRGWDEQLQVPADVSSVRERLVALVD